MTTSAFSGRGKIGEEPPEVNLIVLCKNPAGGTSAPIGSHKDTKMAVIGQRAALSNDRRGCLGHRK